MPIENACLHLPSTPYAQRQTHSTAQHVLIRYEEQMVSGTSRWPGGKGNWGGSWG